MRRLLLITTILLTGIIVITCAVNTPEITPSGTSTTTVPSETSTPVVPSGTNTTVMPSETSTPTESEPSPPYIYQLPSNYAAIFSQPEWEANPTLPSDFFTGNTFMDWYCDITIDELLDTTLDSMQQSGGDWVIFDNYWSYYSLEPPQIGPFPDRSSGGFRDATEEELAAMIEKTHSRNMKFALITELNWDVMRGEWQGWEQQQEFWEKSAKFLSQKADELDNPTEATNQFWDTWFETYGNFILNQAQIAQKYQADTLVIGKQIDGAVRAGNSQRWKDLIAKVRAVYQGPISYAAWTDQNYSQAYDFPCEDLDYIIIYLYNKISDQENPSVTELKESFDSFNKTQFQLISERYGKKILFLTPFQSRDYGAKQEWFEPSAPSPDIGEDLLIQAKMYEAFFQSVQGQEWVQGVWTWGYWWKDDFNNMYTPGDCSFNKSSTIRNKPAMAIFKKWTP